MSSWQIGGDATTSTSGDNFLRAENVPDNDGCQDADQLAFRQVTEEYDQLDREYARLDEAQRNYTRTIYELEKQQNECFKEIKHQKYRMGQIKDQLNKFEKTKKKEGAAPSIFSQVAILRDRMIQKDVQIKEIESTLPKANGYYLRLVLGSINVNLLDRKLKLDYKEQYERFKLWITSIILIISFVNIFANFRALDSILHFLLVWYHCTLTIRESILVVNGSKIKGWWRAISFLTTVATGILVVWPDGSSYIKFRIQFLVYICYTAFLQFLQYYYQYGCLYRLRALGERHSMDITIQGFHSWMWKGLTFLLPFLFVGYCLQFYNFWSLLQMFLYDPECVEWQVPVVCLLYLLISVGNLFTTFLVVYQKVKYMNYIQPIRKITRKISRVVLNNGPKFE